jgi:hypothetical protein
MGSQHGINPTLYSLVFGESVLNDAVAIVLFKCVRAHQTHGVVRADIRCSRFARRTFESQSGEFTSSTLFEVPTRTRTRTRARSTRAKRTDTRWLTPGRAAGSGQVHRHLAGVCGAGRGHGIGRRAGVPPHQSRLPAGELRDAARCSRHAHTCAHVCVIHTHTHTCACSRSCTLRSARLTARAGVWLAGAGVHAALLHELHGVLPRRNRAIVRERARAGGVPVGGRPATADVLRAIARSAHAGRASWRCSSAAWSWATTHGTTCPEVRLALTCALQLSGGGRSHANHQQIWLQEPVPHCRVLPGALVAAAAAARGRPGQSFRSLPCAVRLFGHHGRAQHAAGEALKTRFASPPPR